MICSRWRCEDHGWIRSRSECGVGPDIGWKGATSCRGGTISPDRVVPYTELECSTISTGALTINKASRQRPVSVTQVSQWTPDPSDLFPPAWRSIAPRSDTHSCFFIMNHTTDCHSQCYGSSILMLFHSSMMNSYTHIDTYVFPDFSSSSSSCKTRWCTRHNGGKVSERGHFLDRISTQNTNRLDICYPFLGTFANPNTSLLLPPAWRTIPSTNLKTFVFP